MQKQINPSQFFTWADGQQWFYKGMHLLKTLGSLWLTVWLMYGVVALTVFKLESSLFYLLLAVFSPLVTVGIYHACYRATKQEAGDRKVQLSDYFVAWKEQTSPLLMLGVLLLFMGFVTELVTQFIFDALGLVINEEMAPALMMKNALISQIISTVVSIPMLVVAFFSPQLIFFHKQSIVDALKGSYVGFIHAWKALLMLMLMVVALVFVTAMVGALFSAFLGVVAVVLMSAAMMIIFSINLCGQFFAFDAIFPIDTSSDSDEESEDQFHTEI